MAPAMRYQALPANSDADQRRSLAVSAVSSENLASRPESAVSSEHELPTSSRRALENDAFLNPSHSISNSPSENFLENEADITGSFTYDTDRRTEDPPATFPEKDVSRFNATTWDWLPYTLRKPYLFALFLISIVLAIVVFLLSWASSVYEGLGDDNSTSILLFGWRFTPTLIVVLFVTLETLLLNDARRTEVFARLSYPTVSNASSTVLATRGHWWTDPLNALSSKRNGGLRSQVLLYAAIMNMIGSFILSPLSAAFLSVEPTQMTRDKTFATIPSIGNVTAAISPDDETYFKSVSAQVVNLTTSVWLTDEYAVIPFWPADFSPVPLGATVPILPAQNWTANTTIFQAELDCVPMTMKDLEKDSFQLVSDDGCSMVVVVAIPENGTLTSVADYDDFIYSGITEAYEDEKYFFPVLNAGGWWVPTSIAPSDFSSPLNSQFGNGTALVNVSSQCQDRYIFAVNTPFDVFFVQPLNYSMNVSDSDVFSNTSSFLINSHLCTSRFFMASLATTLSISSSNTSFSFDQNAFNQSKLEIPASEFNVSSFESAFYSETWSMKLNTSGYGTWMGPAVVLGARYAYDPRAMMNDPLLISKAQQVQQRFLGEGLLTSLSKATSQGSASKTGKVTLTKSMVVASFGIGITLGVLFLCTSIMVVLVFYHSRLSRRPLHLDRDPGSAAAVASFLKLPETRSQFEGLERLPAPLIEKRLNELHFGLQTRGLVASQERIPSSNPPPLASFKDWRPFVLRGSGGFLMVLAISLLVVALSVLFAMSESKGIYQKGLVYQFSISFKDGYITSLAPYSIIPTLLAVGMRFWWVALDETFKRLQPYVSMTKQPLSMSAGPALSYQDTPPLWSVWKAAHMKHWLLALICLGTVLTEVFTVGMSALFQRNPASLTSNIILTRDVKLRDIPQIFLVDESSEGSAQGDISTAEILATLYGEAQVLLSWMYGAVIELSYSGSSLQWTQDEWSLAPVNLASARSGPGISASNEPANVTLDTFALRARLECTPVDMSNTSNWLKTWDIGNSTLFNLSAVTSADKQFHTGFELGVGIQQTTSFFLGNGPFSDEKGIWSTFFANPSRVRCCANETDDSPGLSALGYWAPVGLGFDLQGSTGHGGSDTDQEYSLIYTNFTVTWVIGKPFLDEWEEVYGSGHDTGVYLHYLWSSIPEVVTLNCAPIIESSDARVTVSRDDEQVVDFNFSTSPSSYEPAWSDYYLHHNNSGENGDNIQYQIKDNVTVSWGYLFMDALLGAADSARVREVIQWGYKDEPVTDRIFAFRQPGLDADMMSFSTWSILDGNYSALLDPLILAETSNKVFGTFFQHFVSENSSSGGGRAYMPLNLTLPGDLLPIMNTTFVNSETPLAPYQDKNSSTVVSPTVPAILSRPVYKLKMSKVAVGLCLSVLVMLGFTNLIIAIGYRNYFKALPRDMNTLASIMALVYDSPKLLKWVAENGISGGVMQDREVKAVIGYFQGSEGDTRWGIELVEENGEREEVQDEFNGRGTTTGYESSDTRSPEVDPNRM